MDKLSDYGLSPLTYSGDESAKVRAGMSYALAHGYPTISFPAGKTIYVGGSLDGSDAVIIYAGQTVIGNGCTLKLINNAGLSGGEKMLSVRGGTCRGLKLDGNRATNPSATGIGLRDNSVFDGNEVYEWNMYVISTYNARNIIISNNIIHDFRQYGIATGGGDVDSYDITVTGNRLYNVGDVGIKIRGTVRATISDNIIDVPKVIGTSCRGISLYSLDRRNTDIVINNNIIRGNIGRGSGWCAGISSDPVTNKNIKITNNHVSNCAIGLELPGLGGTVVVTGNHVSDCSSCMSPVYAGTTCN